MTILKNSFEKYSSGLVSGPLSLLGKFCTCLLLSSYDPNLNRPDQNSDRDGERTNIVFHRVGELRIKGVDLLLVLLWVKSFKNSFILLRYIYFH